MNKGLRVHRGDNPGKATGKPKTVALTTARTISHSFKKLLKKTPSLLPSFSIVKTITITALATILGINFSYGQSSPSPSLALNPPGISISMDGEKKPDGDKTKSASTATVAVPDTARHMPNDARAKPKVPGMGSAPANQTIIGEPFCDVRFDGENIIFGNFTFGKSGTQIKESAHDETEGNFQKHATVIYVKEKNAVFVHNGYFLVQFMFDNNADGTINCRKISTTETGKPFEKGGFVSSTGGLVNFFQTGETMVCEPGLFGGFTLNGKVFVNEESIYENVKMGIKVEITETEIFIRTKKGGFVFRLKDIVGGEIPPLEKPIVDIENGWIRIKDNTIRDGTARYKILINPTTLTPTQVDRKILPEGEPITKL